MPSGAQEEPARITRPPLKADSLGLELGDTAVGVDEEEVATGQLQHEFGALWAGDCAEAGDLTWKGDATDRGTTPSVQQLDGRVRRRRGDEGR